MKSSGKLVRVGKQGKIIIPQSVLKQVGIDDKTLVEFTFSEHAISMKKKIYRCLVTGEVSDNVKELLPGIYLSKEGMQRLLIELEKNI